MSPFGDDQAGAKAARQRSRAEEGALARGVNRLQALTAARDAARRRGEAGRAEAERLASEVTRLTSEVAARRSAAAETRAALNDRILTFPGLSTPQRLVEELDDRVPVLLLPVRLETRFMTTDGQRELWVRIYPDDVAVHTHEEELTADELEAGMAYWREVWVALQESENPEARRLGAWRALAGEHGGPRAAWIAARTEPETLDASSADELPFPAFEPDDLKPESWSRPPRSFVMPDRFVVMAFAGGARVREVVGEPIPQPLILGPDPQAAEPDLSQSDGDLIAAADLGWIYDFEEAVRIGMGVRIPVDGDAGFDRLVVLGLRLSADREESAELVAELFENHHYAADGMSLLRQGAPTNNTDGQASAFGSVDQAAEASFVVEAGDPLFTSTDVAAEKSDGQRLAEALGIDYRPLQHLDQAGARDFSEALAMNAALWPATLGYFLEEMLELEAGNVGATREFMTGFVTGRGPLPAIRVGTQPYGVLPASAMPRWLWSREVDGDRVPFLEQLQRVLERVDAQWTTLVSRVARVGAPGEPFQNLLGILGLHATSVERHRRHAAGREYAWNFRSFVQPGTVASTLDGFMDLRASQLVADLGLEFDPRPKIFDLAFFLDQDEITDAFVADVERAADEVWSETAALAARYRVSEAAEAANYIGWLFASQIDAIKRQRFRDATDEPPAVPRALLYRLLRRALLLAYHDATARLYVSAGAAEARVAREVELPNVRAERTVTRWELMEARLSVVAPDAGDAPVSVVEFFQTEQGLARPEATDLGDVRSALEVLAGLPTARLERLFAEHLDLCSYRLDAWQTGMVARRLDRLRLPRGEESESRAMGVHLGAFGWLEDVRPRGEPSVVDPAEVPPALAAAGAGPIVEQPGNGGYVHGPSINHAVAAAVLRNAYLTHADPEHPERFAVNLSSERVREALGLLEGIRNGQDLGALLGYEFERGLHDGHALPGGETLDQFILAFRTRYPLVADKITEDPDDDQIETKEARNVIDGYALAEAVLVREPPLEYPYDVPGLPEPDSPAGVAITAEVDRMAASLDAVADLALAEGVFQVTQGNYERGGAMLRALTEGTNPPDPEIVRTPRSGAGIHHRVAIHLSPDAAPAQWPGAPTPRARAEPGLNELLGEIIGPPTDIRYILEFTEGGGSPDVERTIADLGIQPLDLVFLVGDEVHVAAGGDPGTRDATTALESRIAYAYRRLRRDQGDGDIGALSIRFMVPDHPAEWGPDAKTVFELLPLLGALRDLVAGSRPLGADDYRLASETTTDPATDPNPQGVNPAALEARVDTIVQAFADRVGGLDAALVAARAAGARDADFEDLRDRLVTLADHGVPGPFPRDAVGTSSEARRLLLDQAEGVAVAAAAKRDRAIAIKELADLPPEERADLTVAELVERYRQSAREALGAAFNLVPTFSFSNPDELAAAAGFGDPARPDGLTRFSDNRFIVEEWLQGLAPVRERLGRLEDARILASAFRRPELGLHPLQLPFRPADHWVAVEYPEVPVADRDDPAAFRPEGEYLSIVHSVPTSGFEPGARQAGLVVDEWNELIPGRIETTGIAINYDQPGSEPPQAVLLAVTPEVTGSWSWDDLVAILLDTLESARKRAVEPDQVGATAYGQLLPAILSAVTTHQFATISTDLVAATEIAFADDSPEET